jgi:hypothetical protein
MASHTISVGRIPQTASAFWNAAPWLSRLVMLPPMFVLVIITLRYLQHPAQAIPGTMLTTPEAFTDTRVVGAWILTTLLMLIIFLLSKSRLWLGHLQLVALMALVLAIRIFGFLNDGSFHMGNQRRITIAEIVFLVLNSAGLAMQMLSRNWMISSDGSETDEIRARP